MLPITRSATARVLATDAGEYGLLDVRTIEFDVGVAGGENADPES